MDLQPRASRSLPAGCQRPPRCWRRRAPISHSGWRPVPRKSPPSERLARHRANRGAHDGGPVIRSLARLVAEADGRHDMTYLSLDGNVRTTRRPRTLWSTNYFASCHPFAGGVTDDANPTNVNHTGDSTTSTRRSARPRPHPVGLPGACRISTNAQVLGPVTVRRPWAVPRGPNWCPRAREFNHRSSPRRVGQRCRRSDPCWSLPWLPLAGSPRGRLGGGDTGHRRQSGGHRNAGPGLTSGHRRHSLAERWDGGPGGGTTLD